MARLAHGRERDRPDRAPTASRADLERAAAENVKRVVLGAPDSQSLYEISAFLELKTVWHPIGRVRVEILGSGGAVTIPRPGCSCRVCVEAREKGVPYARTGPSVFVHGPDVLIDTPEEAKQQLNRSQVDADRRRPLLPLAPRPHRRAAASGSRATSTSARGRAGSRRRRSTSPSASGTTSRQQLRPRRPVPLHGAPGDGEGRAVAENEPFDARRHDGHADPARRRERPRLPVRGRRASACSSRWTRRTAGRPPDLGPLDLAVLPVGVFEHHPLHGRADDPGGVLQAAGARRRATAQALEMAAGARAAARRPLARRGDGPPLARRARRGSARPTAGSPRTTA